MSNDVLKLDDAEFQYTCKTALSAGDIIEKDFALAQNVDALGYLFTNARASER